MTFHYLQQFIRIFFDLLSFAIIARILLSWIPAGGAVRLREILNDVTEPILGPFRRIIPRIGMIDISPIVALLALDVLQKILLSVLSSL